MNYAPRLSYFIHQVTQSKDIFFELSNEMERTKLNMKLIEEKLKVCEKQEDNAQMKIRTLEGKLHVLETATTDWFGLVSTLQCYTKGEGEGEGKGQGQGQGQGDWEGEGQGQGQDNGEGLEVVDTILSLPQLPRS